MAKKTQLAEDPLIDRLYDLGMDFVAKILSGDVIPTAAQLNVLSYGRAVPVTNPGTLFIGGTCDGHRVVTDRPYFMLPIPPMLPLSRMPMAGKIEQEYRIQTYRRERFHAESEQFPFYVHEHLSIDHAVRRLMDNYVTPAARQS